MSETLTKYIAVLNYPDKTLFVLSGFIYGQNVFEIKWEGEETSIEKILC